MNERKGWAVSLISRCKNSKNSEVRRKAITLYWIMLR
jgi:hypothetical protein